MALIAEVQVRVTNNTTPGRVITLMRPDLESDPGPLWAQRPRLAPEEVSALFHEIMSRSPLNPHIDLKPGESRVIRVVSDAFLPYPAGDGRPYCEFVVTNAEGITYTLPDPRPGLAWRRSLASVDAAPQPGHGGSDPAGANPRP